MIKVRKTRNAYIIFVGKQLGKRRMRWRDNIKMILKEKSCEDERYSWFRNVSSDEIWHCLCLVFGFY